MAHPKRRQSKTRTLKRRTHDKAVAPALAVCSNCGEYYIYHTVCPACGCYRERGIIFSVPEYSRNSPADIKDYGGFIFIVTYQVYRVFEIL